MSKTKLKNLLLGIQEATQQLLDRKGKKLRCNHGLCLEISDILGHTVMDGLDDGKYFAGGMNEGFIICDIIAHVLEINDIKCYKFDLLDPSGEWTTKRKQLCEIILRDLGSEEFFQSLVAFGTGDNLCSLLGRKKV